MIITDKAQIKCYELIESDLKLPADATFTRSSVAYLSDGTQVDANTPRFEPGKFGKAIMVEEGTENLISNPKFEDGLNGWAAGSYLDVAVEDSDCPITTKHAAVTLINSPSNYWFYVSPIDIVPSGTYTVSLWAKIPEGLPVAINLHDVTHNSASNITVTGNGTWQKYTHIRTFSEDTTKAGVYLYHMGDVDTTFYVTAVQLEAKPYPTSFIDGTRSPESLTIPTVGVLNPQEGTVEFWVYPFNTVKTLNHDRLLFDSAGALPGVFWCNIRPNQQLRFVYDSNGVNVALTGGNVPNLSWSRITIRWNTSGVACFINDVLVASDPRPITAISGAVLYIGSDNMQYHANILVDDLRVSSRARTDEEILAAYQSGKPLLADEWTTYKLDFDDKVRITAQGQIICNEFIEI